MPELVIELDAVEARELKLEHLETTLSTLGDAIELRHVTSNHQGPVWLCPDLICRAWTQVQE